MNIHIITIFPEAFESYMGSSIMGRAREKGLFTLFFYKLNDFSNERFHHVDDKAYGMHGQVLSPEPLANAIDFIFEKVWKKIPIIFMTPRGNLLSQEKVETLSKQLEEFIIICGHYEWIDQRIIDIYECQQISIGEYVLSSWELSAQVLIDALVRHIPWVLWNEMSLEEESFSLKLNRQKEYPVYTKPQEFRGLKVPDVLISGHHGEIEKWKKNNCI